MSQEVDMTAQGAEATPAPPRRAGGPPRGGGPRGGGPRGMRPRPPMRGGGGERRGGGGERRGRPRRFGRQSRKVCSFCVDKVDKINCRDIGRLRNYLTDRATIQARRKTGTCSKHQRRLSTAIKRARFLALLPSTSEHIRVAMQYGLRDVPTR